METTPRYNTALSNKLFKIGERFAYRPALTNAINDACLDPRRHESALKNPAGLLRRAGLKLPDGLEFDLFEHPPRSMPFPDWTPWIIELTMCRTVYRRECSGVPLKCKLVEREFCLGWRIYPNPWPPRGPYGI